MMSRTVCSHLVRRTVPILILALAGLVISMPVAHASRKTEAKRLKRALISIEERLDSAKRDARSIRRTAPERHRHLSDLEEQLPLLSAQTDAFSSLHVVGSIVRFTQLHVEDLAADAGMGELRRRIASLTRLRREKIGELESLVLAAQKERATSPLIVGGSIVTYSADWEAVAMCESSGNWKIDAYFDGGLQFLPSTWIGFGGGELARFAHQATKTEQIAIAERVLAIQGPKAWPNCFHPLEYGV